MWIIGIVSYVTPSTWWSACKQSLLNKLWQYSGGHVRVQR